MNETTTTTTTTTTAETTVTESVHVFEKSGLGKAPFTYVGEEYQDISYGRRVIGNIGGAVVTTTPGGTCDHCGAYILNIFKVKSSDGKVFRVGSDCVLKTGDAGLVKKVKKVVAERNKIRKATRDNERIAAAVEKFTANREKFAALPHPNAYFAGQGKTLADWVDFMLKTAGNTGKINAARVIEKTVG